MSYRCRENCARHAQGMCGSRCYRHQICPPLVLILHLCPVFFELLIKRGNVIDTTTTEHGKDKQRYKRALFLVSKERFLRAPSGKNFGYFKRHDGENHFFQIEHDAPLSIPEQFAYAFLSAAITFGIQLVKPIRIIHATVAI